MQGRYLSGYELVEEPLSRRPGAEDVGAAGVQHKLIWRFRNGNALCGSPLLSVLQNNV
jgi:hypothetical protein